MVKSNEAIKYFSCESGLVRDGENEIYRIFERADNGLRFRKIHIKGVTSGEAVDICQVTDVHFNILNERDFEENDPCIMSTYENRGWNKNGSSLPNAIRAFEYGGYCDGLVVTGDILDYLCHGTLEYTKKYLWDAYPQALACIGGHEIARQMQGDVPDEMPTEEKYAMIQEIWGHDIGYYSRVIKGRVLAVVMNNDRARYTAEQYEKFSSDIAMARAEGLTVLIFQHEPVSTGNPKDTDVEFITVGDGSASHDFYNGYCGNQANDSHTRALYKLIIQSADVIKGIFCGHCHNDIYTEVLASYSDERGNAVEAIIPQHILTANAYNNGNVLHIVVE